MITKLLEAFVAASCLSAKFDCLVAHQIGSLLALLHMTVKLAYNIFQQFSKRVSDYEPKYIGATKDVYKLIKDPVITPDDKLALQTEAQDCEERWDSLNDKIRLRVDR